MRDDHSAQEDEVHNSNSLSYEKEMELGINPMLVETCATDDMCIGGSVTISTQEKLIDGPDEPGGINFDYPQMLDVPQSDLCDLDSIPLDSCFNPSDSFIASKSWNRRELIDEYNPDLRYHHKFNYKCKYCDEVFFSRASKLYHMSRKHPRKQLQEREVRKRNAILRCCCCCNFIGKSCRDLRDHKPECHIGEDNVPPNPRAPAGASLQCNKRCCSRFSYNYSRTRHECNYHGGFRLSFSDMRPLQ